MKLLSSWAAEGFSPGEFWEQTAESWSAIMAGREKYHQAMADRDTALAWLIERFARTENLEPLDRYLPKPKVPPTLEEVLAQWDALAAAGYGITVTDLTH